MASITVTLFDRVSPESPASVKLGPFTEIQAHGWTLYLGTGEEITESIRIAGDTDTGGMLYRVESDDLARQYREYDVTMSAD